jgi:hypothetical protein
MEESMLEAAHGKFAFDLELIVRLFDRPPLCENLPPQLPFLPVP